MLNIKPKPIYTVNRHKVVTTCSYLGKWKCYI